MSAQVNGPSSPAGGGGKFIDSIDPDDPEYIKQMIRPAEVKEDVNQMEERKRVSMILNSNAFKKELEEIAIDQIKNGPSPSNLLALQQITELLTPKGGVPFSATQGLANKVKANIIPIADIRGTETMNYTKGEKLLRCKTASMYRLIDIFGWSAGIHAYCTVRLSQDFEHFLLIPYGMLYHEVTAASLLKVDMAADVLDPGSTGLGINKPGFSLHAAIHAARPDIRCIIHLRNPASVSVSSMDCAILPLCTEAVALGEISTSEYVGSLPDQEAKDKLTRSLGPNNKVLVLRNHGIVVGGESIDEAFLLAHNAMTAIETQLQALPIGVDRLVLPSEENRRKAYELANQQSQPEDGSRRKWRKGELEFEGYMRHLDNAGYRTGHVYHEPLSKSTKAREKLNSEIEYPPTATSFAAMYGDDGENLRRQIQARQDELLMKDPVMREIIENSPLRQHFEKQKRAFKTDWLNTPNAYKKEEIQETGTPNPKTITKWKADSSPGKAVPSPVKVENPNVFAPQGDNPKEFKQKFQQIKKEYYTESISAGPQSRILEGVTWEEAEKIKDGHVSGTTDSVIVVGAASKGIIQRDHQHNAVVYKTYYAPNPFDSMTEEEIDKYKQEVEGGATTASDSAGGAAYQETSLDDVVDSPPPVQQQQQPAGSPTTPQPPAIQRSNSAGRADRKPQIVEELQQSFDRGKSKSMPRPKKKNKKEAAANGDQLASPTKSTASSGDGTLDERSSREGSPSKELSSAPEGGSPTKDKKKKKFRMPSFSKKKEKEKKK